MKHLFKRNENENNEIVSKIFIGLAAFIILIWIFCYFGIFDFDMIIVSFFAGISIPVLIIPVIMIYIFHFRKPIMKYILIVELALLMGICYCIFTFQMIIIFVIPMLVAMLYMDKKLLYFAGVINLVSVIAAHIVTVYFVLQPWLEPFVGVENIIRFCIIPRVMQLGACFVILVVLMNRMVSYMSQLEVICEERGHEISEGKATSDSERGELDAYLDMLTEREKDVFFQMLLGKTNVQIADRLCLSVGTVKNYVSSIYDKIGTKERSYLILKFSHFIEGYDQSNT